MGALAGLNAYLRFWGNWLNFAGILGMQILMLCTMHSYLNKKTIYLGAFSLQPNADAVARKIFCGAALIVYILLIFKKWMPMPPVKFQAWDLMIDRAAVAELPAPKHCPMLCETLTRH
jgi:hypothetical protein